MWPAWHGNGHVTGFMGDGINDAAAMRTADVGISVDTAVDVARESAGVILLEKDLTVLEAGVIEGRRTYANIIKLHQDDGEFQFREYVLGAGGQRLLPFLPMTPLQILVLNLIYDLSCTTIPWDNVDEEFLHQPRTWDAGSISSFMLWLGPTSSIFDLLTFVLMYRLVWPGGSGGPCRAWTRRAGRLRGAVPGGLVCGIALLPDPGRSHDPTPKLPFVESRAAWQLTLLTSLGIAVGTVIPSPPGRGPGHGGPARRVFPLAGRHDSGLYAADHRGEAGLHPALRRAAVEAEAGSSRCGFSTEIRTARLETAPTADSRRARCAHPQW